MREKLDCSSLDTILVPQGIEYQAVLRGLRLTQAQQPLVYPIPIGMKPLSNYLKKWQQTLIFPNKLPKGILLIGLGGSLSPQYGIGDVVLYQGCGYISADKILSWRNCDPCLTDRTQRHLDGKVSLVRGITSDRVITTAQEKYQLGQAYQADVVDMEGFAVLDYCNRLQIPVSVLRIISDDCCQNLPDLTSAFSMDGKLQSFPLAVKMLQNPLASVRLIESSLRGLNKLQKIMADLFPHD